MTLLFSSKKSEKIKDIKKRAFNPPRTDFNLGDNSWLFDLPPEKGEEEEEAKKGKEDQVSTKSDLPSVSSSATTATGEKKIFQIQFGACVWSPPKNISYFQQMMQLKHCWR